MPLPKSKAARKAALSLPAQKRARRNPFSDALQIACEQCGIKYQRIPAPRNMQEFRLVTSPTALTTYADRQRLDNVPTSCEPITEDDGRWNASGSRQEWRIYPES